MKKNTLAEAGQIYKFESASRESKSTKSKLKVTPLRLDFSTAAADPFNRLLAGILSYAVLRTRSICRCATSRKESHFLVV